MNGKDLETRLAEIAQGALRDVELTSAEAGFILGIRDPDILVLLNAAYMVRRRYLGNKVRIHVLDNVQSGDCAEDCAYCGQSAHSGNGTASYPEKPEAEILVEAERAYRASAFRHCLVFSGRDSEAGRIERICSVARKIKARFPMELCVSAGLLTEADARGLKAAGVDRYNHNLNTSSRHYPNICTTHSFADRVRTIRIARSAGLEVCSGVIVGLGETGEDLHLMIKELRSVQAAAVPVNFFLPVPGHRVEGYREPSPIDCLKVLCLFRLGLPRAEIRASAGRERYLKSLGPLCLYPANSLFTRGYLTEGGEGEDETIRMIRDAGFEVESVRKGLLKTARQYLGAL